MRHDIEKYNVTLFRLNFECFLSVLCEPALISIYFLVFFPLLLTTNKENMNMKEIHKKEKCP